MIVEKISVDPDREGDLTAGESAEWKLALSFGVKQRAAVTNHWPAIHLHLANLYELSREVAAWSRQPNPALLQRLRLR